MTDHQHYVVWSQYGLVCCPSRSELPAIVEGTPEQHDAAMAADGYALSWCDVEPVAVFADYPVAVFADYPDTEPQAVLDWFNQPRE